MDSKFRFKGVIYEKLGTLQINKRVYLLVINEKNIEYIRVDDVDGKIVYVAPSKKFSLEANAGKSLAQLNERILMNHVVERLEKDINEGKYSSNDLLTKEVTRLQNVIDKKDVGRKTKEKLTDLTEESHINAVNEMLDFFDDSAYKKEEIENDFELPKDIDVTRVFEPIKEDISEYTSLPVADKEQSGDKVENNPVEEKEPEQTNPIGIEEKELDNFTINAMLETKKEELSNEQTNYLENLLEKREEEINQPALEETPKEELVEQPKVLVKTKNKKNAAFADVVIFCLAVQLVLFLGLICVMLFLK